MMNQSFRQDVSQVSAVCAVGDPKYMRTFGCMPETIRLPVSIVVLTMTEECNIRDCLASAGASDGIHVLDSGSTDATCAVARECGARVWSNAFSSFAEQRN